LPPGCDPRRRLLDGDDSGGARGDDDIDVLVDELGGERGVTVIAPGRPAVFDGDVAALGPAELAQPLHKFGDIRAPDRRRGGAEKADGLQLAGLLGVRVVRADQRRQCRGAEQREKLPPPQGRSRHRPKCWRGQPGLVAFH
jgi:hypothetical protein